MAQGHTGECEEYHRTHSENYNRIFGKDFKRYEAPQRVGLVCASRGDEGRLGAPSRPDKRTKLETK